MRANDVGNLWAVTGSFTVPASILMLGMSIEWWVNLDPENKDGRTRESRSWLLEQSVQQNHHSSLRAYFGVFERIKPSILFKLLSFKVWHILINTLNFSWISLIYWSFLHLRSPIFCWMEHAGIRTCSGIFHLHKTHSSSLFYQWLLSS